MFPKVVFLRLFRLQKIQKFAHIRLGAVFFQTADAFRCLYRTSCLPRIKVEWIRSISNHLTKDEEDESLFPQFLFDEVEKAVLLF